MLVVMVVVPVGVLVGGSLRRSDSLHDGLLVVALVPELPLERVREQLKVR